MADLKQFVAAHQDYDVALLALQRERYPMLSDSDFRFCVQQIDGRQRTKDKLPTFAAIDSWLYPPRLNLEQCSSERTARYKTSLLTANPLTASPLTLIDATGGYGVDTFFMSEAADETHYFEQNTELAAIAEHNFCLAGKAIHCYPEPFDLAQLRHLTADNQRPTVLYLDPARRDSHGGKVFRLEDCTPNVVDIVRSVREMAHVRVLLKLSPMLDYHQAIVQLGGNWDVYVVSVNGEVKELLLLFDGTGMIHAIALTDSAEQVFTFMPEEESSAEVQYIAADAPLAGMYVYEPDAAILKAGAFRLISSRYGLRKADKNTHLYFSNISQSDLSGRTWQVLGVYTRAKEVGRVCTRASVLTRNYVLPADTLRKQLCLKDGGDDYIIGCRIADKPLLLHCRRIQ